MSFWRAIGGAIASGVASGVTNELAGLEKKPRKPHKPHKPKPHRPKNGKNDPKGPSTYTSGPPSKNFENSAVGEREGLLRIANVTELASSSGIGDDGVLKSGAVVQMSTRTNVTSVNGTAELDLRPRSIRLTAELGRKADGRAVSSQQNPVAIFILGIFAVVLVAILALAALGFRRQKHRYELVEAIDIKRARDAVWAIV